MSVSQDQRDIAVMDIETDPFEAGRFPRAFAIGILTDKAYNEWWGDDCIDCAMRFLEKYPRKLLIYAHNGGKFDFSFCARYISNPIAIIKSRLGRAKLFHHEIRDSFLIMPFSLAAYRKTPIDYKKFERHCREKHKKEILAYLHDDCCDLFTLVSAFVNRFGRRLTIGKTAMVELRKLHNFNTMNEQSDEFFRQWYYGGRVQCFKSGLLPGPWKLYDVNAMYPHVMKSIKHPVNNSWDETDRLPRSFKKPFFAIIDATNRNALALKTENGLTFKAERGEFYACSHEIEIALEYGLIDIHRVKACYVARQTISFDSFVDKFYAEREVAKRNKDRITDLFGKYMLNAPYGKFGQNPRDYEDCVISFDEFDAFKFINEGYELVERWEEYSIWAKPSHIYDHSFFDVSIAASITSAARSILLDGLQRATEPVYCDTDAILCKSIAGDDVDQFALGKFKLEMECDNAVICGKKLYALFDGTPSKAKFKKVVSKGGELTGKQILKIAQGGTVEYDNPVPTYSWVRPAGFVSRRFKMTVDINEGTG